MKIFVLRHGMTSNADADECRELTETGIKEVEDVVNLRRDDLSGVTRIYTSPLLRVKQTLEIAARILELQELVVESQFLRTGSRLPETGSTLTKILSPGLRLPSRNGWATSCSRCSLIT